MEESLFIFGINVGIYRLLLIEFIPKTLFIFGINSISNNLYIPTFNI